MYKKKGENLLDTLLAEAKTCFSLADAQQKLGLPKNLVVKILSTLRKKNKIIKLSKGYYAYFPPAEKKFGFNILSALDQVMKHRELPYFVGLLSAADYYGAAHHKPQVMQVVIPRQISFRKAKDLGISLHVQKQFPKKGLVRIKTPQGYLWYSSPEYLVLNMLEYEQACGGIENVVAIIKEMLPLLNDDALKQMALEYPVAAVVQRLGYVLEKMNADKALLKILIQVMHKRGASVAKLSAVLPKKGTFESKWKIIQNTRLEMNDDI
ncbi:MAG TPA: type IV toxin-antitoxin system AbiEi family antitoxin [bacterium]|nr:type IV toxin-antitoxin system AbiEi family antitoxin [bacterium]